MLLGELFVARRFEVKSHIELCVKLRAGLGACGSQHFFGDLHHAPVLHLLLEDLGERNLGQDVIGTELDGFFELNLCLLYVVLGEVCAATALAILLPTNFQQN